MRTLILLCLFIGSCLHSAVAQTFGYSLQKDSSAYTALSGATVISAGENFRSKSFMLDIPFAFSVCGGAADSVCIEGNGFLVFNKEKGTAAVAFNSFGSNKDTAQQYSSSILSLTIGTPGNRILKLEFRSVSQNMLSVNDYLSYQVWLYESSNKIEFHTGASAYAMQGSEAPVLLGLVNKNMDTEDKAYLVSGDPAAPAGQLISGESGLVYLNTVPSEGTFITLTPTF